MNTEMNERLEELCKDEEYVKYVLSLGNAEAISKELETKEIDLSPEEIRTIGQLLRKKADGELSDEELEQVSGGLDLFILGCMIFAGGSILGLVIKSACKSC